eukprot:scaffold7834_cov672-Prasinococcus_capsulatus_cf.AAC.3
MAFSPSPGETPHSGRLCQLLTVRASKKGSLEQLLRVIPHSRRYFMTRDAAKARRQAIASREAALAMTSKLVTRSRPVTQYSSIF